MVSSILIQNIYVMHVSVKTKCTVVTVLVHPIYCCFDRRDLEKRIEKSQLKQQQMEQALAAWCEKLMDYRKAVSKCLFNKHKILSQDVWITLLVVEWSTRILSFLIQGDQVAWCEAQACLSPMRTLTVEHNWRALWKNRICTTTMKLRKSLVKAMMPQKTCNYIELFGSSTRDRHARRI